MEEVRASQPVRKILNKILGVDFSKADYEHYSWEGDSLKAAYDKLVANSAVILFDYHTEVEIFKELLQLFHISNEKGYTVTLI